MKFMSKHIIKIYYFNYQNFIRHELKSRIVVNKKKLYSVIMCNRFNYEYHTC